MRRALRQKQVPTTVTLTPWAPPEVTSDTHKDPVALLGAHPELPGAQGPRPALCRAGLIPETSIQAPLFLPTPPTTAEPRLRPERCVLTTHPFQMGHGFLSPGTSACIEMVSVNHLDPTEHWGDANVAFQATAHNSLTLTSNAPLPAGDHLHARTGGARETAKGHVLPATPV